jgi:hypothetical protein
MEATKRGTQVNVAIKHKNYTTMHKEWHTMLLQRSRSVMCEPNNNARLLYHAKILSPKRRYQSVANIYLPPKTITQHNSNNHGQKKEKYQNKEDRKPRCKTQG